MVRSQATSRLRISELAKQGRVGVETVRFYQRKKLLRHPEGSGVAGRHYDSEDVSRLKFIRKAQAAGFTLAQIGELLALDGCSDRKRIRKLAKARLDEIDERLAELGEVRERLVDLVAECATGKNGPCPIVESFSA